MTPEERLKVLLERVHPEWHGFFKWIWEQPEFQFMLGFIEGERRRFNIYPPSDKVLRIFKDLAPSDIRVVLLGQDPYHQKGRATGYAFANESLPTSHSLIEIFKEIVSTHPTSKDPKHLQCSLNNWVEKGVFLCNTALTVREGEPKSHWEIWQFFTKAWIEYLNTHYSGIVWILLGNDAKSYRKLIDEKRHHVLVDVHPAAVARGTSKFTNEVFKKANEIIYGINKEYIF